MNCRWCGSANRDTARFCAICRAPILDRIKIENLQSGQKLKDRYEIRRVLGVGAMGAVYGALDGNLAHKRVAVKEYSPTRITNPTDRTTAVKMFKEEAETLVRLDHPNMPKISDAFEDNGNEYIVMDFIDGMTLEEYLETYGRASEAQVLAWGRQIADVMRYLHSQHPPIIFRDMKPGNVMVDKQGRIKLIDFGIARTFKPGRSQDTQQIGTVGYASPEAYSKKQTEVRSDVYSLAVTLYVLLSGYDPSNDPFSLPPLRSLVPNVSLDLERAIEVGRQLQPEQRWQTMDQMTTALNGAPIYPTYGTAATAPAYANLSGPAIVNRAGSTTGRTRSLTGTLAYAAAGLSNTQLVLLLGGMALLVLAAVWLFAVPIEQADGQFDAKYPMLATIGVLAYVASRKIWAPLLAFTPVAIAAVYVTRAQLASTLIPGAVYIDFGVVILTAVATGGFMTAWAYLQPRFVGEARPEDYTPMQYRLDMIWAILMGLIATVLFTVPSHAYFVWNFWSMYLFGALNGLIGWGVGDFIYQFTIEKKRPSSVH
ncbi:MAG TPA: serine/threonine-protein kinase [Anaerolineae bacterium]|nr:serine/threonine-protein kinase [Anaerolineae bacterium]